MMAMNDKRKQPIGVFDSGVGGISVLQELLKIMPAENYIYLGDSKNAPENTMSAFVLAVENGADMIELDVRQTADGEFIIMHDESLSRTTNSDENVGEVTLEYIETLDAGSWFSEEYKGEKVPTLREVMEFAKENDVFLNIELKPADTDRDDVDGILQIREEYEYKDMCTLGSSKYSLLKEVKEKNPDIYTLYIMYMAFGNVGNMSHIDGFSIKYTYISYDMVENIHEHKKKVYAWTVNNDEVIKKLLLYDVDGIITDNPYETKDTIYNANNGLVIDLLQRFVENF